MHLQLIYRAHNRVHNRYLLCAELSKVARRLHNFSSNTSDAIVDALTRVGNTSSLAQPEREEGEWTYGNDCLNTNV